jgi:hypothetical protein
MSSSSDPHRDRRVASQPRLKFRSSEALGEIVSSFMTSDEMKRMRRFQKVAPALREALPELLLAKVKPVRMQAGVLALEVVDGLALHELRQHHAHALLAALAAHGTGVSRLQWRLARA